jgi:hypothetical protein
MLVEHAEGPEGVPYRSWERRQSVAERRQSVAGADRTPLQRRTSLAAHTALGAPGAMADLMQPPIVALLGLFARWGDGGPFLAGDVEQQQPPQPPQALPEQELAITVAAASEEPTEQTPTEIFCSGPSDPYRRWLLKMDAPGATADSIWPPIVALGVFARWGDGGPFVAGDVPVEQPAQPPAQALPEQELATALPWPPQARSQRGRHRLSRSTLQVPRQA